MVNAGLSMSINLCQKIYNIILTICIPILLLRLLWRSRKAPLYRKRWLERFGIFNPPQRSGGIWVHAVSLGESIIAVPMIKALQIKYPGIPIIVTTTTPTGSETIKKAFANKRSVFHVYLPFDTSWGVKNFLKRIQPQICIIMETELWPNVLHHCGIKKIPVVIANGRLSERSHKGYLRFKNLVKEMLANVSVVAAQTLEDGKRYISLGAAADRVKIMGNIKFDITVSEKLVEQAANLRLQFGDRYIVLAASTHHGEEEQILEAFLNVKEIHHNALLMLCPRHPERYMDVRKIVQQHGLSLITRSSLQLCTDSIDVLLGDTLESLMALYAIADIAFVGGSLVDVGGHNMLEPAAVGTPIIVGPYLHNFVYISEQMLLAGAMVKINDSNSLAKTITRLLDSKERREKMRENGLRVIEKNRGAINNIVAIINDVFHKQSS